MSYRQDFEGIFDVKGKRTYSLPEELFDHVIVILADDRFSSVRLCNPSSNRLTEKRANRFLSEELQEALSCWYLGIRKAIDQVMEGIAVCGHFHSPPITSVTSADANNNVLRSDCIQSVPVRR